MNINRNKWMNATMLGCMALVAISFIPSTVTSSPQFINSQSPFAKQPVQRESSQSWRQSLLPVAGLLLAVMVSMVTAVPPGREETMPGEENGGIKPADGNDLDRPTEIFDGSEQIYREIIDGAADLIYAHDLVGNFILINPAGLRFLGYSTQEVEKLNVERLMAPEYRGVFRHVMDTKLAAGQSALYELAFVTRQGKQRMVEVSSRLVRNVGQPPVVHCIARDVTERKHAETVAAEGSELLDVLLENSRDMIYFKDRESRFVRYSRGLLDHFHAENVDALKGKTDFDFFTKDHAQPAYEDDQEVICTGNSIVGKLEVETHKDGRSTWAKTTKMPWRDKAGNIIGVVGITTDVTALKEAEDKLAAERELLRTLLDNLPDAIYFKDLQSRYVHVSRSMASKTFKYAPALRERRMGERHFSKTKEASDTELVVGLTDFDTFTDEHARPAFNDEQEIIRTGKPILSKLEKETHPDGSVTWCLTSKIAWRDRAGNVIGTFGISKDITALKQAQADLEATHERLLKASRLAGMAEVATDVLHNVGNVLNSVNVSCSLVIDKVQECNASNLVKIPQMLRENTGRLEEFLTSDPRGKHLPEYLVSLAQTFEDQKTFMLHELNQLRSHIEHIKQVISMQQNYAKVAGIEETIEVSQLVNDAIQMNADALTRHAVTYQREFEPVSPILVDKHRVLQILVNLIRNGKYALSDSGRPDRQMTIRIKRCGEDRMQIQVADNGVGIAPQHLTRIFAHGFTTRKDGHGFGLHSGALAAREMGGSLSVHSDGLGKGATFTLELPLRQNRPTA